MAQGPEEARPLTGAHDLSRREILALRELTHDRQARDTQGVFVAEGRKIVAEAAVRGARIRTIVLDRKAAEGHAETLAVARDAVARGAACGLVPPEGFARISDVKSPQGILAVIERPVHAFESTASRERTLLAVGDEIQDPTNVGTLVRTALAFGADAVVLTPGSADPFAPKSVRAASGALLDLPVFERPRGEVAALRGAGFTLFAADPEATETLDRMQPSATRDAVLFGNEGRGLSDELLAAADRRFRIPIARSVESLNVTAAAAVVLHHFAIHRRA